MQDMLAVDFPIVLDESIDSIRIHSQEPFNTNQLKSNDEIRIAIQNQDVITFPHDSVLEVRGKLTYEDGTKAETSSIVNNGIAHLFEEIRYELWGMPIDSTKNVGITSTMIGYVLHSPDDVRALSNCGWDLSSKKNSDLLDSEGNFSVSIPLKYILGFAHDHKKVMVNGRQELILIRKRDDNSAILTTAAAAGGTQPKGKIELTSIKWNVPYIIPSNEMKIKLLKTLNRSKNIVFRAWDLYELPSLPATTKHVWTVTTTNQVETPRLVIVGFQTDRSASQLKDSSVFDHCKLRSAKLFLNSEEYPYEPFIMNFEKNDINIVYGKYLKGQEVYFFGQKNAPLFNKNEFKTISPLLVFDCSRQPEAIKKGVVDIKVLFEAHENFPAKTTAFCTIAHDKILTYHSLQNTVTKVV